MMGGHECYGSKQGGERDYYPLLKFAADRETWLLHILQKIYEKWGHAIEMSQNPIISLSAKEPSYKQRKTSFMNWEEVPQLQFLPLQQSPQH